MDPLYQLPLPYSYPAMPPGSFSMMDGRLREQLSMYGFLAASKGSDYLLSSFPPNSTLPEGSLGADMLNLDAMLASLAVSQPTPAFLPPSQDLLAPAKEVIPRNPDFLRHLAAPPRKPLVDTMMNLPRPFRTEKPIKEGVQRPINWKPRGRDASHNDLQNVAPDKNNIRRTIYVTDVDQQITEEQLAVFFKSCGDVLDCRVCGDPNSAMRFAFVEFATEQSAMQALHLNGTVLGDYALRVLPSKTAIVPVNTQYLPKTTTEREKCSRTVYAANIDKKVDRESVKMFFETICGTVSKIRLLGDWQHATRIAFVEFANAESAKLALGCSGALLGSLPIRVSPSKTPVRDDCFSGGDKASTQSKWG